MTRAREGLFLITVAGNPSAFITELPPERLAGKNDLPVFPTAVESPDMAPTITVENVRRVYASLLYWRTAKARAEGIPEIAIASDRLLHEVATRAPSTPEELREIDGVGEIRVTKYGAEWLDIVHPASPDREMSSGAAQKTPEASIKSGTFTRWLSRLLGR